MDGYWFHDPTCDPTNLRRRAWRYGKDEPWIFRAMNNIADIVQDLRDKYPPVLVEREHL